MSHTTGSNASTPVCLSGVAHRWVLEPVSGPLTAGACKHCGAVKTWRSSPDNVEWERTVKPSGAVRIEREHGEAILAEEAM